MSARFERWLDSDPGHPLGPGYPSGSPLREDGETHRGAWMRLLRGDPCSYCDAPGPSGTLDHIEPRSRPGRSPGGVHCWTNYTGACTRCNANKATKTLLLFLAARSGLRGRSGPARREVVTQRTPLLRPAREYHAHVELRR